MGKTIDTELLKKKSITAKEARYFSDSGEHALNTILRNIKEVALDGADEYVYNAPMCVSAQTAIVDSLESLGYTVRAYHSSESYSVPEHGDSSKPHVRIDIRIVTIYITW